ncbi:MAG TPA: preprotein translocase subunit YajC [Alphaproteobacteria bacterium]|jgi:preprotein translocase subunit YajC|nr:preprotein translocase subunit YajC [Alphaproteobacteria bacterium]
MFISSAYAAAGDAAAAVEPVGAGSLLGPLLPLLLIFVVFYFMVLRPQNKRIVDHRKMIDNLQKGDKVVTGGGLNATVKRLAGNEEVILDLGNGVEVTAQRYSIMMVRDSQAKSDKKEDKKDDKK